MDFLFNIFILLFPEPFDNAASIFELYQQHDEIINNPVSISTLSRIEGYFTDPDDIKTMKNYTIMLYL